MINPRSYLSLIKRHRKQLLAMIGAVFFSATAIGVQRTILSVYTIQLGSSLAHFLIVAPAIALSVFGGAKAFGNYYGGKLSDQRSRQWALRIGLLVLTIGSFSVLFANTLLLFLIANTVIGIGVGLFLASSTVMFTDLVSPKRRARSLSLMELSVYTGTSGGSIMAGIVAQNSFLMSFGIAFLLVILAIIISGFIADTKGMSEKREQRSLAKRGNRVEKVKSEWHGFIDKNHLMDSEELEELYSQLEQTEPDHVVNQEFSYQHLLHPSVMLTFSTGLVSRISDTAIILIFPLLMLTRGFSPFELGVFTSVFTLMWAIGMLFSGPFADQIGRKIPVILGLVTEFSGLGLLIIPAFAHQFSLMFIGITIAGLGRGMYYAIPSSIVSDHVTPDKTGQILGIYRFILDFGYVLGSVLLVVLIEPIISNQNTTDEIVFEASFIVIIFILLVQTLLVSLLLKDPKPRFKQLNLVKKHLNQVRRSMKSLTTSVLEYSSNRIVQSRMLVDQAKVIEQKADNTLELLIENTYAGAWEAVDALEILEFSQKIDKSLGHSLRGLKKLLLVKDRLPDYMYIRMSKFVILLDILVQEVVEIVSLISIQISLAARQTYKVNRAEEVLDQIHEMLWDGVMELDGQLNGMTTLMIAQAIESLEKSANTLEDAVQIIRLVAIKHNIM